MAIEHWKPEWGEATREAMARRLEARGMRVACYTYPPGTFFPEHTHPFDKVDAVVSGRFRITLEGAAYDLGPGDAIRVPAHAVHTAQVLGDEPVVSLDASAA